MAKTYTFRVLRRSDDMVLFQARGRGGALLKACQNREENIAAVKSATGELAARGYAYLTIDGTSAQAATWEIWDASDADRLVRNMDQESAARVCTREAMNAALWRADLIASDPIDGPEARRIADDLVARYAILRAA